MYDKIYYQGELVDDVIYQGVSIVKSTEVPPEESPPEE